MTNLISLEDVRSNRDRDNIDLLKLLNKQVAEIQGYPSREFGYDATFKLWKLVFTDGTAMFFEGEHDFPYVVEIGRAEFQNFDQNTLNRLCDEFEGAEE